MTIEEKWTELEKQIGHNKATAVRGLLIQKGPLAALRALCQCEGRTAEEVIELFEDFVRDGSLEDRAFDYALDCIVDA